MIIFNSTIMVSIWWILFSFRLNPVHSIIFYQAQTTACDTCDRISTNSLRNILCCTKFSKCCLPETLDDYNRQVAAEDGRYYEKKSTKQRAPSVEQKRKFSKKKNKNKKKNYAGKRRIPKLN